METGTPPSLNLGSASSLYDAKDLTFDVINEYPWTLSRNKNALQEVPYIILKEYEIFESTIQSQISFYTTAINRATDTDTNDPLAPYDNLYPGIPTNNYYKFPYFSDINFQIDTPVWATLDAVEQGKRAAVGIAGTAFGQSAAADTERLLNFVGGMYTAALATQYPKVGIMDRPRLWERHEFRNIEIKFPLFNTIAPDDWKRNRTLCWILVNQNLFRKRDFITGVPPVYYEVIIPGQHYSLAACVTNITIYNRGNMRNLLEDDGSSIMVPDVYEINMTLTDLVMPSRNLFQATNYKQKEIVINTANSALPKTDLQPPRNNAVGEIINTGLAATGSLVLGAGTYAAGAIETGAATVLRAGGAIKTFVTGQ